MSEVDNDQQTINDTPEQSAASAADNQEKSFEDSLEFGEPTVDENAEKPKDEAEAPVADDTATPAADNTQVKNDVPEGQEDTPNDTGKDHVETEAERNQRFYQQRQAEKQNRQIIERRVNEVYRPNDVNELRDQYIDQGYDEAQATMLARDDVRSQKDQIAEARADIVELNYRIDSEAMQVMHDFPEFDPNSPQFDKEFAADVAALYTQSAGEVVDKRTGFTVQTNLTPYAFYQRQHDIRERAFNNARVKATSDATRQMAAVAAPSASAHTRQATGDDKQANDLADAFKVI